MVSRSRWRTFVFVNASLALPSNGRRKKPLVLLVVTSLNPVKCRNQPNLFPEMESPKLLSTESIGGYKPHHGFWGEFFGWLLPWSHFWVRKVWSPLFVWRDWYLRINFNVERWIETKRWWLSVQFFGVLVVATIRNVDHLITLFFWTHATNPWWITFRESNIAFQKPPLSVCKENIGNGDGVDFHCYIGGFQ